MIASKIPGRGVLLAVVALAAVPIVPHVAQSTPPRAVVVVVPHVAPPPRAHVVEVPAVRPLVMRTGAPACANVFSKAGPRPGTRCAR